MLVALQPVAAPPSGFRSPAELEALGLAPREVEVALLAAEGYSTLNIAKRLGKSRETVRKQLGSVYRKLEVCNKAELTRVVGGGEIGRAAPAGDGDAPEAQAEGGGVGG